MCNDINKFGFSLLATLKVSLGSMDRIYGGKKFHTRLLILLLLKVYFLRKWIQNGESQTGEITIQRQLQNDNCYKTEKNLPNFLIRNQQF